MTNRIDRADWKTSRFDWELDLDHPTTEEGWPLVVQLLKFERNGLGEKRLVGSREYILDNERTPR